MERIFVDTSAWYALWAPDDHQHHQAKELWASFLAKEGECQPMTSDWVFAETMSLLARRRGISIAKEAGTTLLESRALVWLFVQQENLRDIWRGFQQAPQDGSVVDCSSFVLMRQEHLQTVFTFDKHFSRQGFKVLS